MDIKLRARRTLRPRQSGGEAVLSTRCELLDGGGRCISPRAAPATLASPMSPDPRL
jgi:hypothetical protein